MTCGVRHVSAIAAAVALASGIGVQAQQAPPPSAQTPRPAPAQPAAPAQRREAFRAPQGFSVVLVVADLQAATAPDDVPPAARRALADMKEFLPYKSYKLVDAAWILGQGTGNTTTRLRGPEEQDYEVNLATSPGEGVRVSVRFTLRDAGVSEYAVGVAEMASVADRQREIEKMEREISGMRQKLAEARRANQEDVEKELKSQIETMERRQRSMSAMTYQSKNSPRGRMVIDTSFSMDVGETVVVGTSRLKANSKALIALLTAVPAKGTRQPTTASR